MRAEKNLNIFVSFCHNFHVSVSSFASVINFWNCKETLWTPCMSRSLKGERTLFKQKDTEGEIKRRRKTRENTYACASCSKWNIHPIFYSVDPERRFFWKLIASLLLFNLAKSAKRCAGHQLSFIPISTAIALPPRLTNEATSLKNCFARDERTG